ncbi:GNAT family N-acetyltransferase [Thermococcus nautili]|uniref:GNAT family N-acetyltransferase n=1 Tax=Thermococcus nautili TaxID=195522 RepID=UPI0025567256|nr:GNAT family N-acetyltransferase [Thermococcus nautili]
MGAKKFTCPVCGFTVYAKRENMTTPFSTKKIKTLLCPNFHNIKGHLLQHLVAIKYYKEWRDPQSFLMNPDREGIVPVEPGTEDEVTLYLLWREAILDGYTMFRLPRLEYDWFKAKIMWVDGVPVGYYIEIDRRGTPTLSQLYVRRSYRRRGYGTKLVQDFLDSHPEEEVGIESPNENSLRLLEKMGIIERVENGYKSKGRIVFYPSPL